MNLQQLFAVDFLKGLSNQQGAIGRANALHDAEVRRQYGADYRPEGGGEEMIQVDSPTTYNIHPPATPPAAPAKWAGTLAKLAAVAALLASGAGLALIPAALSRLTAAPPPVPAPTLRPQPAPTPDGDPGTGYSLDFWTPDEVKPAP